MSNDSRHSADHHEHARRHRADHDATLPIKPPIHIGIFDDGVIGRMSAGQQLVSGRCSIVEPHTGHGPDKITYGSRCLAFRNRRSVRLNGRTSGPGWRVELFGVSPWVEVRLPRELG